LPRLRRRKPGAQQQRFATTLELQASLGAPSAMAFTTP